MFLRSYGLGAAFLAGVIRAQEPTSISAEPTSLSPTSTEGSTLSTTSTADKGRKTHEVRVGLAGFTFDPDQIEADVGDVVRFEFFPLDHSVIRAAFGYPCIPWEYVYAHGDPFDSGMQYINTVAHTTFFEVLVDHPEPIFYYCGASNSCLGEGMIGVINPNATQTLKQQKDAREKFQLELVPGDPWPTEGNPMSSVNGLAVTETANAGSSGKSKADDVKAHYHHLNAGQIAGIVIGGTTLLVILGVLIYFCGRKGGLEKGYRKGGYVGKRDLPGNSGASSETTGTTNNTPSMHYASTPVSPYDTILMAGTIPPNPGQIPPTPVQVPSTPGQISPTPGPVHYQLGQFLPSSPQQAPAQAPAPVPVELPTSSDPGNSPLPRYSNHAGNTFSWTPDEESAYRPSEKPERSP